MLVWEVLYQMIHLCGLKFLKLNCLTRMSLINIRSQFKNILVENLTITMSLSSILSFVVLGFFDKNIINFSCKNSCVFLTISLLYYRPACAVLC